jgi:hypothetical protein
VPTVLQGRDVELAQVWEPYTKTRVSDDKALAAVYTHKHVHGCIHTHMSHSHTDIHICYIIIQDEYLKQKLRVVLEGHAAQ